MSCHHGDRQNVGFERQVGHIENRFGDVADIHARFHFHRTVSLGHALRHARGHLRGGVADIDLAAGDIEGASVERDALRETCDGVFGGGVWGGKRARRLG